MTKEIFEIIEEKGSILLESTKKAAIVYLAAEDAPDGKDHYVLIVTNLDHKNEDEDTIDIESAYWEIDDSLIQTAVDHNDPWVIAGAYCGVYKLKEN